MPAVALRAASAFRHSEIAATLGPAVTLGGGQRAEDCAITAIATLKKRAEFLAVRGGAKASCACCLIEGRPRRNMEAAPPRFGFTITRKLGNAVTRNRIRRRLKAAVSAAAPGHAQPGFDYVLVARPAAFDRPFSELVADLAKTLDMLHRARKSGAKPSSSQQDGAAHKKAAP